MKIVVMWDMMPCPDQMVSGHAIAQAVKCHPVTVQVSVRSQARPCGICGGQSETVTGFSSGSAVFPSQYHSTIAPYSFIHLPPTLYNVFLPVLQFSPVSIFPPLLHTTFIHLPPTLYNVFLPVLQFSPVSIIPPVLHAHPFLHH